MQASVLRSAFSFLACNSSILSASSRCLVSADDVTLGLLFCNTFTLATCFANMASENMGIMLVSAREIRDPRIFKAIMYASMQRWSVAQFWFNPRGRFKISQRPCGGTSWTGCRESWPLDSTLHRRLRQLRDAAAALAPQGFCRSPSPLR